MAVDTFKEFVPGLSSPATGGEAVTPSDSTDITKTSRALYIGGGGTVVLVTADGTTLTFAGLAAGQTLPVRANRIRATGTTATSIVALW